MSWSEAESLKYEVSCQLGGITIEVENEDGDYQVNIKALFFNQVELDRLNNLKKSYNTFLTVVEHNGPKVLYAIY